VVHRDFKPANVLVGTDGRARVTDFGLSRPGPALELPPLASPLVTREGTLVGTVVYMSPEQLTGKPADERSDQFSFCVSLAEALSGERPFAGEDWPTVMLSQSKKPALGRVPRALRPIIAKGLSVDPAARYASLAALLTALERSQRLGWSAVAATAVASLLVTAMIVGAPATQLREMHRAFTPWTQESFVPVVMAAQDLPAGTVLSFDLIFQRGMPETYVTPSSLKPDQVHTVIGRQLLVPVKQGDVLLASQFANGLRAVDGAVVQQALAPVASSMQACAKTFHQARPDVHGQLDLRLQLDASGEAMPFFAGVAVASPEEAALRLCLVDAIAWVRFPDSEVGTEAFDFPFRYSQRRFASNLCQ
jgi:hypothetical protein